MPQIDPKLSTGLRGLDHVLRGLIPGDNIVWQVDQIDDYRPFVAPYVRAADDIAQQVVYFRFAQHKPLLSPGENISVHTLDPAGGFETFVTHIHDVIAQTGPGGYYVFDCLSELAEQWYSDQMLGNLFMLTCPYLYDMEALAYFGLLRNRHSIQATAAILDTTQVLLDVYRHDRGIYVHPWKVWSRYSANMHMLHRWEPENNDEFTPVSESITISEILTSKPWSPLESGDRDIGIWAETFREGDAELLKLQQGSEETAATRECFRRLLRMAISRDERVLRLAEEYLTLEDVIRIGRRIAGTGLIGGKSVGMLLARSILYRDAPPLANRLEQHDSFYIGSDVFYTFLVQNGLWWVREMQKNTKTFLESAGRGRLQILRGSFPEYITRQFEDILDYFGQSPIIVRSSSLLEDNFGNAFAGKYESIFLANQGPRVRRLDDFLTAVRTIYASAMSEEALTYRMERGLLNRDEQMALLVQRVSGARRGPLYYPHIAGVGFSFNPYVWSPQIDPSAGVLRLVAGLGTRAVDRSDDDYTRLVALNAPDRRPESGAEEVRRYSQRKLDVLDLEANQLLSKPLEDVMTGTQSLPLELLTTRQENPVTEKETEEVLTFDGLFRDTPFIPEMRNLLAVVHEAYDHPVDIEFTANFTQPERGEYRINIVQCRPFQVKEPGQPEVPPAVAPDQRLLEVHGGLIGHNRVAQVDRIIYVHPEAYLECTQRERYAVARAVGKAVHATPGRRELTQLLIGPGRWGTSTPSLGVPASFSDINRVSFLCELVMTTGDVVPEVSLGTHFFSDLVEADIVYFALYPDREGNVLNAEMLRSAPNRLGDLVASEGKWSNVISVIDAADLSSEGVMMHTDSLHQHAVCYRR